MVVNKVIISLFVIWLSAVSYSEGGNELVYNYSSAFSLKADEIYDNLQGPHKKPDINVFKSAYKGYHVLYQQGKVNNPILTVIDFSLHSKYKRLWIIDMNKQQILYHTLVAHGKNTGMALAKTFSNIPHSNQSSLGFYLTAETYYGKHGLSLRLDGIDENFNDNARKRNIVIHGAKYANPSFVSKYGRLGRSFGCPALPTAVHKEIINKIKNQSVLFIHYPDKNYYKRSYFFNTGEVKT